MKQKAAYALLFLSVIVAGVRSHTYSAVLFDQKKDTAKKNQVPTIQYMVILTADQVNTLYNIVRSSGKLTAGQAEDYITWFSKQCNPMDAKTITVKKKN